MNMTVVTFELVTVCGLLLLATVAASKEQEEMPAEFESILNEGRPLEANQLGSIVKDFGGHLQKTMDAEMNQLLNEMQKKPSKGNHEAREKHPQREMSAEELERLKRENSEASNDIKKHFEVLGDTGGNLPQMGLKSRAISFAAGASSRLAAAGSYISNKMRDGLETVGNSLKKRIPAKLRRFFKWPTFLKFKIRFHKVYSSLREELYRQMIFLRTHIVVGMQHVRYLLGRDKHLLGQTQYADVTEKEFVDNVGNHYAERPEDLDPSVKRGLDGKYLEKLKELSKSGKNIFGQPVAKVDGKSRKKRFAIYRDEEAEHQSKRQRRNRRDVDGDEEMSDDEEEEMYDADELNEEEDDFDDVQLENELDSEYDKNPEDAFRAIDEFVADIDFDDLDDIEDNLDEALDANNDFTPTDLRKTGCLIKPDNQNSCGNCYSMAVQGLASYYYCMESETKETPHYNARFVSACGKYMTPEGKLPDIKGCRGGIFTLAFQFAQKVGVQLLAAYNVACYSANVTDENVCPYPRPPTSDISQHGWKAAIKTIPFFQRNDVVIMRKQEIDLHLQTVGPVAVNACIWEKMKEYKGGILEKLVPLSRGTLHSMIIVGHDKDPNGRPYYIIKNSFGVAWGEEGYLRVYSDVFDDITQLLYGMRPKGD